MSSIKISPPELARIIDLVEDKERVGISLDSCHALAAGCDFRTAELEKTVGIDSVSRWQFNLPLPRQPIAKSKTDRSAQSQEIPTRLCRHSRPFA
ncbi:MAG: hypothetical protein OXK78_04635 [Caldilineaceae bacterium]|nr:hypothetical protein [Caldilineaceae bacterium]